MTRTAIHMWRTWFSVPLVVLLLNTISIHGIRFSAGKWPYAHSICFLHTNVPVNICGMLSRWCRKWILLFVSKIDVLEVTMNTWHFIIFHNELNALHIWFLPHYCTFNGNSLGLHLFTSSLYLISSELWKILLKIN